MSLEKKSVHVRLDQDDHKRLSVLAEVAGLDMGELAAMVVSEAIRKKCHEASVVESKLAEAGLSGRGHDRRGKGRE